MTMTAMGDPTYSGTTAKLSATTEGDTAPLRVPGPSRELRTETHPSPTHEPHEAEEDGYGHGV
jgi:hypothetical protein